MNTKLIFGGIITVVLLGLYVYSVSMAVSVINCVTTSGCQNLTVGSFTEGMISALTLIGGLVSALVISELAVTKPGEVPVARVFIAQRASDGSKGPGERVVRAITLLYLAVWLVAGLTAYIVGYLLHPGVLQPLSDVGQSWLGLAVASGYAYFGINPGR